MQKPNGEVAYTRQGAFHRDGTGKVLLSNGSTMIPPITVPGNAVDVKISPQGEVKAQMQDGSEQDLGQIQLVRFVNEQGLHSMGDGLFRPTLASGAPTQGVPGEDGLGSLMQGALEGSNVNVAQSMVEMIQAQRAYEMNTKIMGVADQMLSATIQIK
ncbi:MAG: flagellar hook-basal body complex protein [Proteobacteria bacterium]|nr:MAG: flagellar hook-basal body complex protein [Pseudomonadota bacterium]